MAPKQAEFVGFGISPFSLKARWALQLLGVDFKETPYNVAPNYLAELPLRLRMRKPTGIITAPILFPNDGSGAIMDSFKIVQWALKKAPAKATEVVPEGQLEEVAKWNQLADTVLHYYRLQLVAALSDDPEARIKMGGGPDNAAADKSLMGLGKRLASKHAKDKEYSVEMARSALQELRTALQAHGLSDTNTTAYILGPGANGTFSYADIAMAVTMDELTPPSGLPGSVANPLAGHVPSIKSLADEFPDLVAWRAAVYKQHMPAKPEAEAPKEEAAAAAEVAAEQPAATEAAAAETAGADADVATATPAAIAEPVTAAAAPEAVAVDAEVAAAAPGNPTPATA